MGLGSAIHSWRGAFGDAYTERNCSGGREEAFRNIMGFMPARPSTILEVGCNRGLNLDAVRALGYTGLAGVEPNARARSLCEHPVIEGRADSIPVTDASYDLVFTCGVLIHVPPSDLEASCREIVRVSNRYVLAMEYFAQEVEEKAYRNRWGMLWKRDFGRVYLDMGLSPVAQGFLWKPATGMDDITWWLFTK